MSSESVQVISLGMGWPFLKIEKLNPNSLQEYLLRKGFLAALRMTIKNM